jgi:hypothetical protein
MLKDAAYNPPLVARAESEPGRSLWTSHIAQDPPSVQYDQVIQQGPEGDRAILRWLDLVVSSPNFDHEIAHRRKTLDSAMCTEYPRLQRIQKD